MSTMSPDEYNEWLKEHSPYAVERMPDNGKSCFGPKMYHPSNKEGHHG